MPVRVDSRGGRVLSWKEGDGALEGSEREFRDWLDGKDVPLKSRIAFETWKEPSSRERMDALLMGGCPEDTLNKMLGVPVESTAVYRELFFDESVFHTYLDRLSYAESYCGNSPTENLVLRALNNGYELILLQICNMVPTRKDSLNILKRVFAAAVYKATSIQYTGTGGTADKRAMEHCHLALKVLETMDSLGVDKEEEVAGGAMAKFVTVLKESKSLPEDFKENLIG